MPLFVLTETAAGYALLKAKDKKLLQRDDFLELSSSAERVCEMLKLKKFEKFDSAAAALEESASLLEGKVTPMLSKLLDQMKDEKKASLAVADPKLGTAISKLPQLQITPIADSSTNELYRAIRTYLPELIPGLNQQDISTMSLGLSHSLSRHKLKFSPDKVDTMIIQAIALLDDLDKELNTYAMRVKEWYGWHFPEMAKIINDNLAYSKVILKMGMRTNASETDLAEVLPEEIETAIKAAAEVSMGTEITIEDLDNIRSLAEQVVEFTEYRAQLSSYLSARMQAIAPNLTTLVGELVGARLIAHSGSLINLAKSPASTIQILGAEKALFRALKTKHDTPKYGLIYHASLVGQATGKNKGKIARMLATKTALGLRVDSLADWGTEGEGVAREPSDEEKMAISVTNRLKIERRLRQLEGKPLGPRGVAIGPNGQTTQPGKWELKEARKYNAAADGLSSDAPAAVEVSDATSGADQSSKKATKLIEEVDDDDDEDSDDDDDEDSDEEMADTTTTTPPAKKTTVPLTNGDSSSAKKSKKSKDSEKDAKRAEKLARKQERQEKREAKEARKAKKSEAEATEVKEALAKQKAKLAEIEKQANAGTAETSSKKRKHDVDEDKVAKKKKRKHEGEDEDKSEKKKKRKSEGAAEEPEKKKKKRQSV